MSFRDDRDALLARVHALEQEVTDLRTRLNDAQKAPEPPAGAETESPEPAGAGAGDPGEALDRASSIRALVEARDARVRAAERQRDEADRRDARRLARRPLRVHVERGGSRPRIVIERMMLRDKLRAQLPWGFGFALLNPGVFVMMGLGALLWLGAGLSILTAVLLTLVLWPVLLGLINLGWAALSRPRYILELTEDDHFALFVGLPRSPVLFGRLPELEVHLDQPDPARLREVRIEDSERRYTIEHLTAHDLEALDRALPRRVARQ